MQAGDLRMLSMRYRPPKLRTFALNKFNMQLAIECDHR